MRLFDLHCDTLFETLKQKKDILRNDGHIDLTRGMCFSPWYQCFAIWVKDGIADERAKREVSRMLQQANTFEKQYPALFHIYRQPTEWFSALITPLTAILTVENGGVAAGGDAFPDEWIRAGIRMVSLTWNGANRWAQGCDGEPGKGLTPVGIAAVRKMEQHGILIDAAHLNRRSFWDVCRITPGPFVVSHTASATVFPSVRGLNDMQFCEVKRRGGIVGLDLCAAHLGGLSVERFVAHLEHFLSLGGEQAVALGCDFDGIDLPPQYEGIRMLACLYDRLLQRNYAESLIDDLFFDNAYRFFKRHTR